MIGGPRVDALMACDSWGSLPDGWNVVRENEYLPSIGSTFAWIVLFRSKATHMERIFIAFDGFILFRFLIGYEKIRVYSGCDMGCESCEYCTAVWCSIAVPVCMMYDMYAGVCVNCFYFI